MVKIHCEKLSKEGNMESKKRFMYVNPTVRSDTQVAYVFTESWSRFTVKN